VQANVAISGQKAQQKLEEQKKLAVDKYATLEKHAADAAASVNSTLAMSVAASAEALSAAEAEKKKIGEEVAALQLEMDTFASNTSVVQTADEQKLNELLDKKLDLFAYEFIAEAEKGEGFKALFSLELTTRIYWTGSFLTDYYHFLRLNHPLIGLFMHHKMHLVNTFERWLLFLAGILCSFISAFVTPPACDPDLPLKCENTCDWEVSSLTSLQEASPSNGLCFDFKFGSCAWGTMCDNCGPRQMPDYCSNEETHYAWTFGFGVVVAVYLAMLQSLAKCTCIQKWSDQGCCGCLKRCCEKLAQFAMICGFCIGCIIVLTFVGVVYLVGTSNSPFLNSTISLTTSSTDSSTTDNYNPLAFNWAGFFGSQCTSWGYSFLLSVPGFWWTYRKGDPRKWAENDTTSLKTSLKMSSDV